MWADNADQMSIFYSSSRSLKTDYTRYVYHQSSSSCLISSTGKRTTAGALDDGMNSIIRYVNNNFYDGYFEDCLNLTFNRVAMSEQADRLVVRMKRYSFVCSPHSIKSLTIVTIDHHQLSFISLFKILEGKIMM